MELDNQTSTLSVWDIYTQLETIGNGNHEPINVDWMTKKFGVDRETLISHLTALEILELIDFSDKEKVRLCN